MSLEWYTPPIFPAKSTRTEEGQLDTPSEVLAANPNRKKFILQNVGTVPIFIFLGDDPVSGINYSLILQAGAGASDGKGGALIDDIYKGAVQALGTSPGAKLALVEM